MPYSSYYQKVDNKSRHVSSREFSGEEVQQWLKAGLEDAVSVGNALFAKHLLQMGASANSFVGHGDDTVLHLAVTNAHGTMVRVLVDHGAVHDAANKNDSTPLQLAAMVGNLQAAEELLFAGARVNRRNELSGNSALDLAACGTNVGVLSTLIGNAENIDDSDNQGRTALHKATARGNVPAMEMLARRGANVNARDRRWRTPLHVAARGGSSAAVLSLLQLGATIDVVDSDGRTPLHLTMFTSTHCRSKAAHALMGAGANVNLRCSGDDLSPVEYAADNGHVRLLKALVDHGADVNCTNLEGLTALHCAADNDNPEAVGALLECGADVDAPDVDGGTPLHHASVEDSAEAARCLLVNGAAINAVNYFNQSPLQVAVRQSWEDSHVDVVDLLLKAGADETCVDDEGLTLAQAMGLDLGNILFILESTAPHYNVRTLELLANAPADKAWRRRRFLTMCRALPDKAPVRSDLNVDSGSSNEQQACERGRMTRRRRRKFAKVSTKKPGDGGGSGSEGVVLADTGVDGAAEVERVVARVAGMAEEGIFRLVVHFL